MTNPLLDQPSSGWWLRYRREILIALVFTLASNLFVSWFARLPRWVQNQPSLQRAGYCKWDCIWYADVARLGYESEPRSGIQASWHFLPLFPITVVPVMRLLKMEPMRATVLTSKLFLFTAILSFLWMLGDEVSDHSDAVLAATLVAFNPYVIYAHAGYAEPLYFTLGACGFAALRGKRFVASGLAGGLLSATRMQGMVFTVPYVIGALREFGVRRLVRERGLTFLFGLLLCPVGLCLYAIYLHRLTGDALASVHSFAAWGISSGNPFANIFANLHAAGWPRYFAWTAIVGLLFSGLLAALRKYEMAIFLALCILMPASAEMAGMPRFLWWQPPTLYLVYRLLKRYPQLRMFYALVAGGMAAVTTYLWISGTVWMT